ncbi:cbb3-type cytochrome oxidase assembly protein CcoS [Marinobacter sp. SS21]|uniref:cbb3-type cytochrome oxidase assembly protein CcoS n=1 Tax=Marinobacter sp. SS21 TaxID=2979460 RepID=UPI00232DCD38|nr:cbb3-type cytochrome oxidase assembly protein CcoS [Marinobacter sp. SS21]MDC0662062.1 cbb3-type cytochrome oxidase assembly protein CcoS [Marinobacter sp. SS21]
MILVPVSLILVALGIVLFSWAVKNGQYDDLEGPAHRILYDDDRDLIPDEARRNDGAMAEHTRDGLPNRVNDSSKDHTG